MRFISLFSGIEAATLAWSAIRGECVAVCEVDPFAKKVLKHYYPDVPNLGDVTKVSAAAVMGLGDVDAVVFGFPCQDVSVAGKRGGLRNAEGEATRSGLFFDAMRIVRWSGARFAVAENVPGLLSNDGGRDFAAVVGEMAGVRVDVPDGGWENSGFLLGPEGLVEWAVLDAQYFGVPQRRRRVFLIRDSGDWASRPPILLERESLQGHSAPRRKAGEGFTHDLAPSLTASGRRVERSRDTRGQDPVVSVWPTSIASTLDAHFGDKMGLENQHIDGGAGLFVYAETAHTLRGEGFDASEDGTGRGTPLVALPLQAGSGRRGYGVEENYVAGPLTTNPYADNEAQETKLVLAFSSKDHGADASELSPTLRAMGHSGSHANGGGQVAVAFTASAQANSYAWERPVYPTLSAQIPNDSSNIQVGIRQGMAVRRLTPLECERLQGFPDGFTKISDKTADGNRYKALGNSFAVPVVRWIGQRIQESTQHKGAPQ